MGAEEKCCYNSSEKEEFVKELQRLLACYQIASFDDRKVIWAVLNKYAAYID
ncbi:MAG: hypothetical protein ACI4EO_07790 [Blautia sp.]